METVLKQQIVRLKELGFEFSEIVESTNKDPMETELNFYNDGIPLSIKLGNILECDDATGIINDSIWWSCCGMELNHDVPMCTVCKEWCA